MPSRICPQCFREFQLTSFYDDESNEFTRECQECREINNSAQSSYFDQLGDLSSAPSDYLQNLFESSSIDPRLLAGIATEASAAVPVSLDAPLPTSRACSKCGYFKLDQFQYEGDDEATCQRCRDKTSTDAEKDIEAAAAVSVPTEFAAPQSSRKKCSGCRRSRPLDQFQSDKTGETKRCQRCRDVEKNRRKRKAAAAYRAANSTGTAARSSKHCSRCEHERPLDQFRSFSKPGETSLCQECRTIMKMQKERRLVARRTRAAARTSKYCPRCEHERPLDQFRSILKPGETSECQECRTKKNMQKERRLAALRIRAAARSSKHCSHCERERPLDQFRSISKPGETNHCQECRTKMKIYDERRRVALQTRTATAVSKYCSRCDIERPLDQFQSNGQPRETKTCQNCRTKMNRQNERRRVALQTRTATALSKYCSGCLRERPLDKFRTESQTGETKVCQDCRCRTNAAAKKRSEAIRAAFPATSQAKQCSSCGMARSLDHFKSKSKSRETKTCQKCRDRGAKSSAAATRKSN